MRVPKRVGTFLDRKEFIMATATTKTATTTEMPELAEKIREQLVSTIQQGQQLTINAIETWVKAVSVLPMPELPTVPGVPSMPGMQAATKFTFDVASDLLNSQRDFALQLEKALVSTKTA
jgi:hypothetical protein